MKLTCRLLRLFELFMLLYINYIMMLMSGSLEICDELRVKCFMWYLEVIGKNLNTMNFFLQQWWCIQDDDKQLKYDYVVTLGS